jgi:hypothetical protein
MSELRVDHVLHAVDDLDRAADHFLASYGLASVEGGRHPGHGTANRIVPLGPDYIELIAVVDAAEAQRSPLGLRVASGTGWIGYALRTPDLDGVVGAEEPTTTMRRVRPDGVELSWTIARFDDFAEGRGPFLIQWHVSDELLPGSTPIEHQVEPVGLGPLEMSQGTITRVVVRLADGSRLAI